MKYILVILSLVILSCTNNKISYKTSAYDAFTGWDFYSNGKVSIGISKELNLPIYEHKIHDSNGEFFDEGEYFCDPDDIIDIKSNNLSFRKYLAYTQFKRDTVLSNERDFFRVKYIYDDLYKEKFDFSVSKSLRPNENNIDVEVLFSNKYTEKLDFSFITQDAAYMNLKDKNQKNVVPLSTVANEIINGFFFKKLDIGDRVGTKHINDSFYGGYLITNIDYHCKVWGGVTKNYILFNKHLKNDGYILGFADLSTTDNLTIGDIINTYTSKIPKGKLKNRVIIFECKDVLPGDNVSIWFSQYGEND